MQFLILHYCAPSRDRRPIGVFLFDPLRERLTWRLLNDWAQFADAEDIECLSCLAADLVKYAREMGAGQFLAHLEDTLSNVLRISDRCPIQVVDAKLCLDRLFAEHVLGTEGLADGAAVRSR